MGISVILLINMCLFGIIDFSLFTFFENLFSKILEVLEKDKNQVNLNGKYNFFFKENKFNINIK
jgi:hypothetical protein